MVNPATDIHNLNAVGLVSDWGTEADRQPLGLTFDNSENPKTLHDRVTARIDRCAYARTLPTLIVQHPTISEPVDCPLFPIQHPVGDADVSTCIHSVRSQVSIHCIRCLRLIVYCRAIRCPFDLLPRRS